MTLKASHVASQRPATFAERKALQMHAYQLPATPVTLAGRLEQVDAWLNYVDPETGEATPLISKELAARPLASAREP